jgi:hypothetical protein
VWARLQRHGSIRDPQGQLEAMRAKAALGGIDRLLRG